MQYGSQNSSDVVFYLGISESDHLITLCLQAASALQVILDLIIMNITIDLHHQAKLRAVVIHNVRSQRPLAAKLQSVQAPAA